MLNKICSTVTLAFALLLALVPMPSSIAAACDESSGVEVDPAELLADQITPWLDRWSECPSPLSIQIFCQIEIDRKPQSIEILFVRDTADRFVLACKHPDYEATLWRTEERTALVLPKHRTVFFTEGETDSTHHLQTTRFIDRWLSEGTWLYAAKNLLDSTEAADLAGAILFLSKMNPKSIDGSPSSNEQPYWELRDGSTLWISEEIARFQSQRAKVVCEVLAAHDPGTQKALKDLSTFESNHAKDFWPDCEIQPLERAELERTFSRGLRRAIEVVAPSPRLKQPSQKARSVDHGLLEWENGERVALLWGTPEEIGKAHGELLKQEAWRCIDSVVYGFGSVQTIATGKWFRSELESAYERLAPFIPERHKTETDALADSLGVDRKLMAVVNVFPELFHCSGFAVFGSATKDGKLYHGRVLDYMTTIGLQDSATTFVIAPDGYLPFATIGYGGFIGSVSGMNASQVSLGEMGGRGEGKWDGVPMATLMRRALEECHSLEEVKQLWSTSPRTCEYYYVFADGKNRTAVGVAATPESLQFVAPGEAHPLLGDGISDSVVLSAGDRLEELKRRIRESHGKIDAEIGQQLMCRPVAMDSNLHNVLFVPEDGVFYVANASHDQPAADRPYTRISLQEKIVRIRSQSATVWKALDSIPASPIDPVGKASDILAGLLWKAAEFPVHLEHHDDKQFLRFPSPLTTDDPDNDRVALEWFAAKDSDVGRQSFPAVLVVHESGKGMTVGKMIARGLASQGVHAFMIHLPHYGVRRTAMASQADPALALRQSIADVRRALDAIATCPGVDSTRIALQGTSLGGFVAATTAGLDDRPNRLIILLAGGDLKSVVRDGKKDAQGFRKQMIDRGLSEEAIDRALDAVEPLHLAHRISSQRTWLYSGKYDDVVPPRSSRLFADAARIPSSQHIELEADHYSGALLLPGIVKEIADIAKQH
jgi:dienelactone hydrolase